VPNLVVHSVTKLLSGALGRRPRAAVAALRPTAAPTYAGTVPLSPEPSPVRWRPTLRCAGIRTLPLRFRQAQANAEVLALRLGLHPEVERVRFPGLV